MKYCLFLAITTLSIMSNASSDEDKKSKYFLHCQLAAVDIMKDQGEFKGKSQNQQLASVNLACKFIYEEIEKGNKWDLVKNPKFDGCSDAVRLLLPKGTTEKLEREKRAKYCAEYL